MPRILWLLIFMGYALVSTAQEKRGNTYAVVIGISSYEHASIKPLAYSHKDAQLFARWLQSPSGGAVPDSNMRVLLNERATIGAIYNALDWLKQQCREGDLAYIYFSGHGDLETVNQQNNGYLLAYNTPPNNYPNHAIAVEALNKDANFLTLDKNVRVVLITDACHSGKLAGDFFKGKQWVGQQLQQVLHQEIRLTACAAHEEAAEGEFWGGGRGVFSYYLLMGLYGRAERVRDNRISFEELQQFIDSAFRQAEFLKLLRHPQPPVLDGNPRLVLATVDPAAGTSVQQEDVREPELPPLDYFFQQVARYPLELFIDFNRLQILPSDSLPLHILDQCVQWQDSLNQRADNDAPYFGGFAHLDSLHLLADQLRRQPLLNKQFNERLVEWAHANVQAMINAFLAGEEAELEKRQYYYTGARNYRDVVPLIETALSLIPPNHHLAAVLQTNRYYLLGILTRMEMAVSRNTDSLLRMAFRYQYQTLALEPYAAYVHNELGNLYVHQRRFDSAQYHYNLASALASTWAIPWSNQVRMNLMTKNYTQARLALQNADSLQPGLSYVYINAGLLMERENKLLEALSYFLRATKLNPVHYLPFERLAYLYLQTGDYEQANRFFFKAASLKNDFAVNDAYFRYGVELGGIPPVELYVRADSCFRHLLPGAYQQHPLWLLLTTLGTQETLQPDTFVNNLRKIVHLRPGIPLAHHYLGKALLAQGKFNEAAAFLQEAIRRHRTDSLLVHETDYQTDNPQLVECIFHLLTGFNYDAEEDFYLLARTYEQQQQYPEAIAVYRQVLVRENRKLSEQAVYKDYTYHAQNGSPDMSPYEYLLGLYDMPVKISSAVQLMKLHEQLQQYDQAEAVLLEQVERSRTAGDLRRKAVQDRVPGTWQQTGRIFNIFWVKTNRELEITVHDFYNRMMQRQPRNYYWKQQAARFLYQRLLLAYSQMPEEQYVSFTNDLVNYAYPWQTGQEPFDTQEAQWPLPGLNDTIFIQLPAFHPVTTAIGLFQEAQALAPGEEADITNARMLADLFRWVGNDAAAKKWYTYVLRRHPANTGIRQALVRLLLYAGYHKEAQQQLDTLQQQHLLDPAALQHLIFFHTVAGNYTRVTELIRQSPVTDLADSCRRLLQEANLLMVQQQYKEAVALLQQQFPLVPQADSNHAQPPALQPLLARRYYMLARCYALLRKDKSARTYLEKALAAGFCQAQVLQHDPAWASLQKRRGNANLFQLETEEAACTGNEREDVFLTPNLYRIPGEAANWEQ
ncbi:MAG TPA: caspase family protein [Lacibacter sp.]|nr:caspase family protein [Lacibacter sp.]